MSILKKFSQLYCFIEVIPSEDHPRWGTMESSTMSKEYEKLVDKAFKTVLLTDKEDIWPAFVKIFGGQINE